MGISLSELVENIVGKEEIAPYEHKEQFFLVQPCFQKVSGVVASK